MSNKMIERVAKIIVDEMHKQCLPICTIDDKPAANYALVAKAAIQVMREPTEEMLDAGFKLEHYLMVYQAMIDAALKED